MTPANAEQIAPTRRAPSSPSTSIRTSPAPNVPTIAPIVFAAYNRPNDSLRCASALRWRVSVGSVAPISTVALTQYDTHGRQVGYQTSSDGQLELFNWLRENPHRLHLGQIGFCRPTGSQRRFKSRTFQPSNRS